jgi:hypothetical protein
LTGDMPNDIILRVVGVSVRWKDSAEHEHRYMGSGSRSDVVDRREWVWSAWNAHARVNWGRSKRGPDLDGAPHGPDKTTLALFKTPKPCGYSLQVAWYKLKKTKIKNHSV